MEYITNKELNNINLSKTKIILGFLKKQLHSNLNTKNKIYDSLKKENETKKKELQQQMMIDNEFERESESAIKNINSEKNQLKLLNFQIENEIQNTEEDEKKKLDDDEFKDLADNMINRLYKSNSEENDFAENEDELKTIINSLNNMNKDDIRKTMGILKEKADDDSKKKRFSKFANKLKAILKAKRLFKF